MYYFNAKKETQIIVSWYTCKHRDTERHYDCWFRLLNSPVNTNLKYNKQINQLLEPYGALEEKKDTTFIIILTSITDRTAPIHWALHLQSTVCHFFTLSKADTKAASSLNVSLISSENFLWIPSNSSIYCCGPYKWILEKWVLSHYVTAMSFIHFILSLITWALGIVSHEHA